MGDYGERDCVCIFGAGDEVQFGALDGCRLWSRHRGDHMATIWRPYDDEEKVSAEIRRERYLALAIRAIHVRFAEGVCQNGPRRFALALLVCIPEHPPPPPSPLQNAQSVNLCICVYVDRLSDELMKL